MKIVQDMSDLQNKFTEMPDKNKLLQEMEKKQDQYRVTDKNSGFAWSVAEQSLNLSFFYIQFQALTQLTAENNLFRESFLWLPSLNGTILNNAFTLDWFNQMPANLAYCILPSLLFVEMYLRVNQVTEEVKDESWEPVS